MNTRILLVDDDPDLLQGLARILRRNFELELAQRGAPPATQSDRTRRAALFLTGGDALGGGEPPTGTAGAPPPPRPIGARAYGASTNARNSLVPRELPAFVDQSGKAALDLIAAAEQPFAAVVADMGMPVMNGILLLQRVEHVAPALLEKLRVWIELDRVVEPIVVQATAATSPTPRY